MNLLFEIVKILGNTLYILYECIIYIPINIFLFGDDDGISELHTIVIHYINDCFINIGVNISWKTIEIIDTTSKFYNKSVVPYFHNITNDYFRNSILLIKNGDITSHIKNIESLSKMNVKDMVYDIILYTDYSLNNSKKNYTIIIDNVHDVTKSTESLKYKSNVNFIIFQVIIDGDKYDVNLKEPFNYIVKNNTLKESFFKWYMKTVYNVELPSEFSVYYMLQDMSIVNLHSPFFIRLNESSLTSFSSGKPKSVVKSDPKIDETLKIEDNNNLITDILKTERMKQYNE